MARSDAEHQTYQHASLANGGASASQSVELLGDSVIPIVNKLQDIFSQLGSAGTIDLPQVQLSPFLTTSSFSGPALGLLAKRLGSGRCHHSMHPRLCVTSCA